MYDSKDGKTKRFHGQWLQPGSKTILQEAAHPSVLFTMLECDEIDLDTIIMKCNIKMLAHDDDSALPEYDPKNQNNFFCGQVRSPFIFKSSELVSVSLGTRNAQHSSIFLKNRSMVLWHFASRTNRALVAGWTRKGNSSRIPGSRHRPPTTE